MIQTRTFVVKFKSGDVRECLLEKGMLVHVLNSGYQISTSDDSIESVQVITPSTSHTKWTTLVPVPPTSWREYVHAHATLRSGASDNPDSPNPGWKWDRRPRSVDPDATGEDPGLDSPLPPELFGQN